MGRNMRRYARTPLSQKLGPIFEQNNEAVLRDLGIERLIHGWLQDSECYWTPDDFSVIGDIGEPIDMNVWRFLLRIYGVIDTYGGGIKFMETELEILRKRREGNPIEELPSGSEFEYERKEDEAEPEPELNLGPKTDKLLPSHKGSNDSTSYHDSYHDNNRRLIRIRKLQAYRDGGRVNFL